MGAKDKEKSRGSLWRAVYRASHMARGLSTLCTAWETALARSGERIPETQDAGKQGSLEDGGELGWAGLRDW